jgi:hypothetical protein
LRKRRGWEEIRGKVGGGGERERMGGGGSVGPDECVSFSYRFSFLFVHERIFAN